VELDKVLHPLVGGSDRNPSYSNLCSRQWLDSHASQVAAASMAVTTCASLAAGGALDVAHGLQRSDAFRLAAAARMLLRSGEAAAAILVNACGGTLAPDAPGRPPAQDSAQCKLLEQCIRQSGPQVTALSCLLCFATARRPSRLLSRWKCR
jgi:hypothetical protein